MALKLLVTLDGSKFSEGILPAAIRMAETTQADVLLLHVNRPAHEVAMAEPHYDPAGDAQAAALTRSAAPNPRIREVETAIQATERLKQETLGYLRPIATRFPSGAQCLVRVGSHAAPEILACAQEIGADLIAMATHGRTGLAHVVIGSVAEAVVRSGKVPVLLIRPAMPSV